MLGGLWQRGEGRELQRVRLPAEGKKQLALQRKCGETRCELGEKYITALHEYITYRFVGTYMDKHIKGTFNDLPWCSLAFAIDFSEVFSLDPLAELQSLYYSKETVKILVIVTVRHAMLELDGEQSTPEDFVPVFENHFYCADTAEVCRERERGMRDRERERELCSGACTKSRAGLALVSALWSPRVNSS